MEAETEGFFSQQNSATSIVTTDSENLLAPTQILVNNTPVNSTAQTTALLSTAANKLEPKKSVHFLTTATSTTSLPSQEPIRRLRPELNTLLSVLIKQTRAALKASHHIELLTTAVQTRNPPTGLRPRVNPRIPDNKNITFLIEWDQITTDAAISYTRLLLRHWESVQTGAIENISYIEERINTQQATEQEWTFIKEVIKQNNITDKRRPGKET